MNLLCGRFVIDLSRPRVMGVLNVTPDSFSDGGEIASVDRAVSRARAMVGEGADIIDVGGESTRPGAEPVPEQEELRRVVPVIEALAGELDVPLSVDTSKPAVMREALRAGAAMINDVTALRSGNALAVAAASDAALCLMHMRGQPGTMQQNPVYDDVVAEVSGFLRRRVAEAVAAGIRQDRLVLDPGFGFGKTLEHNLELLAGLERLVDLGLPVLVGISRKSMIATLLGGRPVGERVHGSIAAAVIAAMKGARIIRAHDVGPTVDALKIATAIIDAGGEG